MSPALCTCSSNCSYDEDDIQSAGKVYMFSTPLDGDEPDWYSGNTSLAQLGDEVEAYTSQDGHVLLGIAASTMGMHSDTVI